MKVYLNNEALEGEWELVHGWTPTWATANHDEPCVLLGWVRQFRQGQWHVLFSAQRQHHSTRPGQVDALVEAIVQGDVPAQTPMAAIFSQILQTSVPKYLKLESLELQPYIRSYLTFWLPHFQSEVIRDEEGASDASVRYW